MTQTTRLALPYIAAAQAQKHVTHNEALRRLDAIVQLAVRSRSALSPPADPEEGEAYIVPVGAEGSWSGRDGDVAVLQDGAWAFHRPGEGWLAWVADETALLVRDGTGWRIATDAAADAGADPATLGVNAEADETNRLSVSSPATLLNHETGSHRLKVNKAGPQETASLLFQSGFSGRAEMGVAGSDAFSVKVSADGVQWTVALEIDPATGVVTMPQTAAGGSAPAGPHTHAIAEVEGLADALDARAARADATIDDSLRIAGEGGATGQANAVTFAIETDPANPNVSAVVARPQVPNTRFFFGDAARRFYALNLSNVGTVENMPSFSTPDAIRWGYHAQAAMVVGRTQNRIEHHACAPSGAGHAFFVNDAGYSRTGETRVLDVEVARVTSHVPLALPVVEDADLPPVAQSLAGELVCVRETDGTIRLALMTGTAWERVASA